ncbi:MAG: FAD-dependent oxidoreductase [Acidobacteriota bacterium]
MAGHQVDRTVRSDVIVIGSGVAGLTAALEVAPLSVSVLTKGRLGRASSSWLAQGGIAVAWDPEDSPDQHAADTLAVGGGISNREAVETITREGPAIISHLLELGVHFDADLSGRLRLGREAAHSRSRIVHANGDATGAAVVETLASTAGRVSSVQVFEDCQALELIVEDGRVSGVLSRQSGEGVTAFLAGATILATGGIGSVYLWTTNPLESTGDGLAMAARAGALLADLEFMQFHPTALAVEASPVPLLTEAIRGEGAILIDGKGRRFMPDDHPATRVHGANRLASNSLLEAMVYGRRVALDVKEDWKPRKIKGRFAVGAELNYDAKRRDSVKRKIQALMWNQVGLLRNAAGLQTALDTLTKMELERDIGLGETRNMITVGRLVAFAALTREESRGVHYRTDIPRSRTKWDRHLYLTDPLLQLREEALAEAQ